SGPPQSGKGLYPKPYRRVLQGLVNIDPSAHPKACRDGYSALYTRARSLFRDLAMARADGSLRSLLARLSRIDVLAIDNWAMEACDCRRGRRCAVPRPRSTGVSTVDAALYASRMAVDEHCCADTAGARNIGCANQEGDPGFSAGQTRCRNRDEGRDSARIRR